MNHSYPWAIVAGIGLLLIFIAFFKRRNAHKFMEGNVDVPELYLEKTVENKVRSIQHAMRQIVVGTNGDLQDTRREARMKGVGEDLSKLKEGFRKKEFSLSVYNKKLDELIKKLNH